MRGPVSLVLSGFFLLAPDVLAADALAADEPALKTPAAVSTKRFSASFTAPFVFVATGSGVIISEQGEILTNHHVIADSCSPLSPVLTVRLADGGEAAARLVATDPVGDLALLRLEPLPRIPRFAVLSATIPPPGTPVIAVGNPFALGDLDDQPTISQGVLSTGRIVRQTYVDCLQHDAAANPGNSGGPLFTRDGALLGITGAIRSRSGFRINSGIGLTIAAPAIARFLPALRSAPGGWVLRTAAPEGLTLERDDHGVRVQNPVAPLRSGDRVLRIDDRSCPSVMTAENLFCSWPWVAGMTIDVQILRDGKELTVAVPAGRSVIPGKPWIGFTLTERGGRLLVADLEAQSPAAGAGVVNDETVLSANGVTLNTRLDALRVTAPLAIGDRLELTLRAGDGAERTVTCWVAAAHQP